MGIVAISGAYIVLGFARANTSSNIRVSKKFLMFLQANFARDLCTPLFFIDLYVNYNYPTSTKYCD